MADRTRRRDELTEEPQKDMGNLLSVQPQTVKSDAGRDGITN